MSKGSGAAAIIDLCLTARLSPALRRIYIDTSMSPGSRVQVAVNKSFHVFQL